MVSRVVETFLDVRASGIPQAAEVHGPEEDKGAGSEDVSSELRRFMARTNQSLEEIRLRQRAQPSHNPFPILQCGSDERPVIHIMKTIDIHVILLELRVN